MPLVLRTTATDSDLLEIALQIGVESGRPIAADRIVDEIIECCEDLAARSSIASIGTAAPELGAGVRLLSHRRWVIIFRYIDEGVLVLRIADGRQDYLSWKL